MKYIVPALITSAMFSTANAALPVREENQTSENFNPTITLTDSCENGGNNVELGYIGAPTSAGWVVVLITKANGSIPPKLEPYKISPEQSRITIGCSSAISSSIVWRHQGDYKPSDLGNAYQSLVIQHWNNRTWTLINYNCAQDIHVKLSNSKSELIPQLNNKLGKANFVYIPAGTKVTEAWYGNPIGTSNCNGKW
jgi:hypothetical protein